MSREHLSLATPELWAGVECTVNRVRDQYFDQLAQNGHDERLSDLDLFAELGVRALRFPVLWERTAPESPEQADWSWADTRLARLRELGIRPIVGLVHHGSGPAHTSLVDPEFPNKLAAYARAVAERYPHLDAYTPVNEPLTTARFSGLYGLWYPHGRDHRTFITALLNECRAVALSMRAIREVNSQALLIQTEDLGKAYSTPRRSYQAQFENELRWLTFDLLTGRVGREHPMWEYFRLSGIPESEIEWFAENPCPPDIIGVNHYVTSERFLDHRLERYPSCTHGGNEFHRYADVEAVRVCAEGLAGARTLLRETWDRYALPLAVTEVHLGCTREEQLRWFAEIHRGVCELKDEGVDVRALTAWSLLGAYDWNHLLTCARGHYEPGIFDLRAPQPRPTALARMLRELAHGREFEHPVLQSPGWWRRLDRLLYPPVSRARQRVEERRKRGVAMQRGTARPLVITGATGTLGRAFARLCEVRGISFQLLARDEMDIAAPASVEAALAEYDPWAVINTAGYVRVDDAEQDAERCLRENAEGAEILARACAARGAQFLTFSSDLVFDGLNRATPYLESDEPAPLNVYGRSKMEAERRVLAAHAGALVIRTSAFFSPWDEYNFLTNALRTLAGGRTFEAADDARISPTYVPDLVNASLDLLIDEEQGLWHLANAGDITWAEFARRAARRAGFDPSSIIARPTAHFNLAASRPLYSVLGTERGQLLPTLEDAFERYMQERGAAFGQSVREAVQQQAGAS